MPKKPERYAVFITERTYPWKGKHSGGVQVSPRIQGKNLWWWLPAEQPLPKIGDLVVVHLDQGVHPEWGIRLVEEQDATSTE